MALWFKKTRKHELLLNYNHNDLKERVTKNWKLLHEYRGEASWKILMQQLELCHNMEVLSLSKLDANERSLTRLAIHKGVVDFISDLKAALNHEFSRIEKEKTKEGNVSYGDKVVGKPSRGRKRPTFS